MKHMQQRPFELTKTSDVVAAIFTQKFEAAHPPHAGETPAQYYVRGFLWVGTDGGQRALEDAIIEAATFVLNA